MNNLQLQLNELYQKYLNKIFSDQDFYKQILNFEISSPIFLDTETEISNYLNSNYKILYVGKETNYWFNQEERKYYNLSDDLSNHDKYLHALTDLYKNFNIGHTYKKPIFTFMDILFERLQSRIKNVGILWTNLLRHDYFGYGKVPYNVEQKITFDNNYIFRRELEILKPDAIIFVTGPNYDYILENTFSGIKKFPIENKPEREICRFQHNNLPPKSYRVYHPSYHWRKNKDYRWVLADLLDKLITVN